MNARKRLGRSKRGSRGAALIIVLFFIVIISMLLVGVATSSVSHEKLAYVDSTWCGAIDLAEAGLNFEMRKISQNTANADQSPGSTYSLGTGTFKVYCKNANGTTPWTPPGDVTIVSTGTVSGVSRTVTTMAHCGSGSADYACYAVHQGNVNGTPKITGAIGTNGTFNINGNPTITGEIDLNGPGATANINPPGSFTPVKKQNPVVWPTVNDIATATFPQGGLAWLALNSDNAFATPAIVANKVTMNGNGTLTLHGKAGGANYYLTSLTMNGNCKVVLDNTAGPITVWFGPNGGNGSCNFNGGTATLKMSQDPAKACRLYSAMSSAVNLNGNSELDMGVYNYNGAIGGQVNFNGTGDIYGSVISNNFAFNGNPAVKYTAGYFSPGGTDYVFDGSWAELTAR